MLTSTQLAIVRHLKDHVWSSVDVHLKETRLVANYPNTEDLKTLIGVALLELSARVAVVLGMGEDQFGFLAREAHRMETTRAQDPGMRVVL